MPTVRGERRDVAVLAIAPPATPIAAPASGPKGDFDVVVEDLG